MSQHRSEKEIFDEAMNVTGACNVSGLVASMHRAVIELWAIARERRKGTEWVNRHPVVILYLDQINYLAGYSDSSARAAYEFTPQDPVGELKEAAGDVDAVLRGEGQ